VSELRSVVEAFRGEALADLPDARVEEDFAELQRAVELLEAERLRRLAEIDRRGLHERDGFLSAASWLASSHRVAWGDARAELRIARALRDMPRSLAALQEGEVSMSAIKVLAAARQTDPSAFDRSEPQLLEAARVHAIGDLQRVVGFWRQQVDNAHDLPGDDAARARRRLHASATYLGMVRVDGDLDPETGEALLTALGAVLDAETRSNTGEDDRTPAQRRADALGEICRQWLDRSDRPMVGGERPHVTLTVDAGMLAGRTAGMPELDRTGAVPEEIAKRHLCDASVMRVVLSGRSQPMDVGRRTPIVPPAMRRAVIVRDRRCRFPGCDRPQSWCDAHHIVHWADGGPTAVGNLLLLCRRHHRMVHAPGGFRLELLDGQPAFTRPDGSLLEDRAPP
jgi:hypothetical protein